MTNPTWKHADVFPIIERIIAELCESTTDAITVDEIAPRLLKDQTASRVIEESRQTRNDGTTREQIASNMVAWFSQKFPKHRSERKFPFEGSRVEPKGPWRYRLNRGSKN
jgi:hypothetical protein